MKKNRRPFGKILMILAIAFFYLPILYMIVFSFNEGKSLTSFTGFSLRWYQHMLESSDMMTALYTTFSVAVLATLISTVIGVVLGLLAGYFGGVVDMIIMRFTDMVMSFPYILLVLVAASIFKPGLWSIILILGFVDWPGIARLVRGNVLSLRETNFVKGNLVAGMPLRHILFSEILPNTTAPILVYATSVLALSMLDEAALSFLGMGVQPPTASLGNMLNGAQSLTVLTKQPWLWIPPGLMIVVLVIAINFIGDALRDALDPNSKN